MEDDVNIGIVPSQGLVPPKLRITDLETIKISESRPNYSSASPANKFGHPQEMTTIARQVNSQVDRKVVTDQFTII